LAPELTYNAVVGKHGARAKRRSGVSLQIDIDAEELAAFCRRAGVLRLSFFGSVLREDFGPESDIDVLVEFEPEPA